MKVFKHVVIISASIFLTLGVPFMSTDYFSSLVNGSEVDAVSSASVIIDQPSGNYVVLINTDKHTDPENLELWREFFSGEEVSFIFEDIKCNVAKSDSGGVQMAESYQSRLPENQMAIKKEDVTLMVSKADYGKFDIIIISEEMANAYSLSNAYQNTNIEVIKVKGEDE